MAPSLAIDLPFSSLVELQEQESQKHRCHPIYRDIPAKHCKDATAFLEFMGGEGRHMYDIFSILSHILVNSSTWPRVDLLRCYARATRRLNTKDHAIATPSLTPRIIEEATDQTKSVYGSLGDFISLSDDPAIRAAAGSWQITHRSLNTLMQTFRLPVSAGSVVVVAISNGPYMASVCLSVPCCYVAAPVNPSTGTEQFLSDVAQLRPSCIVTMAPEAERLGLTHEWSEASGIKVVIAQADNHRVINLQEINGGPISTQPESPRRNGPDDTVLLLFTSGTSGTKKIVPITLHSLLVGCASVIESWELSATDICVNMMPLHHV